MQRTIAIACPADTPEDVQTAFDAFVGAMSGRATPGDSHALLMLATSWTTWRKATASVAELGPVVMSGGTAIANPSLAVAHQAHGQILALSRELGLTAASRQKLQTEDHDEA